MKIKIEIKVNDSIIFTRVFDFTDYTVGTIITDRLRTQAIIDIMSQLEYPENADLQIYMEKIE